MMKHEFFCLYELFDWRKKISLTIELMMTHYLIICGASEYERIITNTFFLIFIWLIFYPVFSAFFKIWGFMQDYQEKPTSLKQIENYNGRITGW